MRRIACGMVLCCAVLACAGPSWAASPENEVGIEESRLRRPRPIEAPERVSVPIDIPPEGPMPSAVTDQPPFPVSRVILEGVTLLPPKRARQLVQPVEGKTVTLADLRKVAYDITRWYRGRGYVTSRAIVPAQAIEQGDVTIRVIEGKVGRILIEGNRFTRANWLERQLRVRPGDMLWLPRLEGGLRAVNANLDRSVTVVLAPGEDPETTDLIVRVTDRLPLHAGYAVDNLGTEETGEIRHSLSVSDSNLSGRDDQLSARGLLSEFGGLLGGAVSYQTPVTEWLLASLDISGVRSRLGEDLKPLDARGTAVTIAPGLLVPIVRRAQWELTATSGFEWKRIRTFQGKLATAKDDLRVARLGADVLEQDRFGRGFISHEVRAGLPGFMGGSQAVDQAASRPGAGGSFITWVINAIRMQQGPLGTTVLVRAAAQVAGDRLLSAEQFRIGGMDTVRGYPEGEYLGDRGYQWTIEGRLPLDQYLPWPADPDAAVNRLRCPVTLAGFWDFAEASLKGPAAGEDADARLSGVGIGLRVRPTQDSLIQVDLAWPVGDPSSEHDTRRVHFICRVGF